MKFLRAATLSATLVSASIGLRAQGIPVIDAANLAQAINQVLAWEAQYNQMLQQIQQLQFQTENSIRNLESITGNRGLGMISNNITASVVDPNLQAQLSQINTYAGSYEAIKSQLNNLTQASTTRFAQIQSLMLAINSTNDPKAIAELNGRIQAEQAMIANEQKEVALVRQQLELQSRALDAQRVQRDINASTQRVKAAP
jgi:type IV secretion system protein VirB5